MNETKALEITLNKLNEIIEYQAKRIRQLEAQLVGCENSLNKTNNAFKELEAENEKLRDKWDRLDMTNTRMAIKLQERIDVLTKKLGIDNPWHNPKDVERIKELESALHKIDNWAKAYPIKAFPEPDLKKAAKVLKAAGLTLDAISASNMRHVINGVKEIVEQALKGGE